MSLYVTSFRHNEMIQVVKGRQVIYLSSIVFIMGIDELVTQWTGYGIYHVSNQMVSFIKESVSYDHRFCMVVFLFQQSISNNSGNTNLKKVIENTRHRF